MLNGKMMKKIYYYIICLFAVFILIWGAIDVVSGILSLTFASPVPQYEPAPEAEAPPGMEGNVAGPFLEEYYQRQMVLDRIGDSMARIVVAGLVLAFATWRINLLEKTEA